MFGDYGHPMIGWTLGSGSDYEYDPTTGSAVDIPDESAPVPFGPQPTAETVATNWLVSHGYMSDPGIAVSQLPGGLPPGPSPRVNVSLPSWFTQRSVIAGLENWMVVIGGVLIGGLLLSTSGRRR